MPTTAELFMAKVNEIPEPVTGEEYLAAVDEFLRIGTAKEISEDSGMLLFPDGSYIMISGDPLSRPIMECGRVA